MYKFIHCEIVYNNRILKTIQVSVLKQTLALMSFSVYSVFDYQSLCAPKVGQSVPWLVQSSCSTALLPVTSSLSVSSSTPDIKGWKAPDQSNVQNKSLKNVVEGLAFPMAVIREGIINIRILKSGLISWQGLENLVVFLIGDDYQGTSILI